MSLIGNYYAGGIVASIVSNGIQSNFSEVSFNGSVTASVASGFIGII